MKNELTNKRYVGQTTKTVNKRLNGIEKAVSKIAGKLDVDYSIFEKET